MRLHGIRTTVGMPLNGRCRSGRSRLTGSMKNRRRTGFITHLAQLMLAVQPSIRVTISNIVAGTFVW